MSTLACLPRYAINAILAWRMVDALCAQVQALQTLTIVNNVCFLNAIVTVVPKLSTLARRKRITSLAKNIVPRRLDNKRAFVFSCV
jgi:hypothetical protein